MVLSFRHVEFEAHSDSMCIDGFYTAHATVWVLRGNCFLLQVTPYKQMRALVGPGANAGRVSKSNIRVVLYTCLSVL